MVRFTLGTVSCQQPGKPSCDVHGPLSGVLDLNQPLLGFSAARSCAFRAFLPIYSLYKKLVITFLKALFSVEVCYDLGNAQDSIFSIQGLGYLGLCPPNFLEQKSFCPDHLPSQFRNIGPEPHGSTLKYPFLGLRSYWNP